MSELYILFERQEAKVLLVATSDIVSSIKKLCWPYIQVSEVQREIDDVWTIYTKSEAKIKNVDLKSFKYTPPGEAEANILYNGNFKIISLHEIEESLWIIQHALRLIRKILRLQLLERGTLFVHGGMVEYKNNGIAFLGKKKAGKTSSILSFLANEKSSTYITNDDLSLQLNETDGNVYGYGWPRSISIRSDSLQKINGLNIDIKELSHPIHTQHKEKFNSYYLYPKELSHFANLKIVENERISTFIFPSFTSNESNQAEIKRLSKEEVFERLKENFEVNPDKFNEFLLPYFNTINMVIVIKKLQVYAQKIPGYQLLQSFNCLENGTNCIVEEITNLESGCEHS